MIDHVAVNVSDLERSKRFRVTTSRPCASRPSSPIALAYPCDAGTSVKAAVPIRL